MAGIASFTDLQTNVLAYLKRADLASMFPTFVQLAEDFFTRTINTKSRRASFIITPTQPINDLPSDWQRLIEAWYAGKPLPFWPNSFASPYANSPENAIGRGFQIIGNQIVLSLPQLGGVLQVDYYGDLEGLSASNPSNWLLEDSPSIYLWGVLHEAALYIRDDTRTVAWMQKRDSAIQTYIDDDEESRLPEQVPLVIRKG